MSWTCLTSEVDDEAWLGLTGERGVGLATRVQYTRPPPHTPVIYKGAMDASALTNFVTLSTAYSRTAWTGIYKGRYLGLREQRTVRPAPIPRAPTPR